MSWRTRTMYGLVDDKPLYALTCTRFAAGADAASTSVAPLAVEWPTTVWPSSTGTSAPSSPSAVVVLPSRLTPASSLGLAPVPIARDAFGLGPVPAASDGGP